MRWRLVNLVVVILSQCIRVLSHHIRHLNCMHFLFASYISVKLEKQRNKSTQLSNQVDEHRDHGLLSEARPLVSTAGLLVSCGDSEIINGKLAERGPGALGQLVSS